MTINPFVLLGSLVMLGAVVDLLRRGILRERFAALWLVVSVMMVFGAIFPAAIEAVSRALGFTLPANMLFFAAILLLLLVAIQLSHEVSRLEARTRRLAEDLALLSDEVRDQSVRWDRARD